MIKHEQSIVVIGGGTGLSTMLHGLKQRFQDITAIVTVADDGGSSGILRREYNMLPPGDIRNCIGAFAQSDQNIEELLNFRFKSGNLKGHTIGNLILAGLNEISDDFEEAINKMCNIFKINGKVIPVTNENVTLSAILENGVVIKGEKNIGIKRNSKIQKVYLEPKTPKTSETVINELEKADIIVIGPGSLYTSIIPNLLVAGVTETIKKSRAKKIYVCNIMTQPGETDGYTVYDHIKAIEQHSYKGIVDFVLANDGKIPKKVANRYIKKHSDIVKIDDENLSYLNLIKGNMLMIKDGYIRHDAEKLAKAIFSIGCLNEK